MHHIRWGSSLVAVPRGRTKLCLLEAVPSLDRCSRKSCTRDTFQQSLSEIERAPRSWIFYHIASLKLCERGRGSWISDHGRHGMSSSPVPLNTRHVGEL
ncbi:hypothetical protein TNCV_1663041 [Trichonephila clavipes]|nr:hypothetical protein TNCV_1663041 [Trichonephila clavipes]